MQQTTPWVQAYRPKTLSQVAEHADTVHAIQEMVKQNTMMNLIFVGPMGVGKSSIATILSQKLYGKNASIMTLRLNASDSRGINDIRMIIQKFAEVFYEKRRLIILDEVDSMTLDAQLALRKIMDNNNKRVNFCLICNYIRKIHPAILSRSVMFYFNPVNVDTVAERLKTIMDNENRTIDNKVLKELALLCKGDMRQAVHLLYSLSFRDNITSYDVYYFTGNVMPEHRENMYILLSSINRDNFKIMFHRLLNLITGHGYNLYQVIQIACEFIRSTKQYRLLPSLADIETRLAYDFSEKIQLVAILSLFIE